SPSTTTGSSGAAWPAAAVVRTRAVARTVTAQPRTERTRGPDIRVTSWLRGRTLGTLLTCQLRVRFLRFADVSARGVVLLLAEVLEQTAQLRADEVARRDVTEGEPQRGELAGEVLGVGEVPLGALTVLLGGHPVPVVLPVLCEEDERRRVRGLEGEHERERGEAESRAHV